MSEKKPVKAKGVEGKNLEQKDPEFLRSQAYKALGQRDPGSGSGSRAPDMTPVTPGVYELMSRLMDTRNPQSLDDVRRLGSVLGAEDMALASRLPVGLGRNPLYGSPARKRLIDMNAFVRGHQGGNLAPLLTRWAQSDQFMDQPSEPDALDAYRRGGK